MKYLYLFYCLKYFPQPSAENSRVPSVVVKLGFYVRKVKILRFSAGVVFCHYRWPRHLVSTYNMFIINYYTRIWCLSKITNYHQISPPRYRFWLDGERWNQQKKIFQQYWKIFEIFSADSIFLHPIRCDIKTVIFEHWTTVLQCRSKVSTSMVVF